MRPLKNSLLFWIGLLWAVGGACPTRAAQLRAGAARADLTPPLEMKAALGGYGERMSKPATGIHDRVWAKALVLSNGTQRFAIVTADVLGFPPGFKDAVAQALATDRWQPDEILLLPSHSHTSIDMSALNPKNTLPIPQIGMFHRELYDRTIAKVAEAIREAAKQPVPATVGTASARLDGWNRNRRGAQTVDDELTITRLDTAGGPPLAVLVNWTAHPTFMDAEHMEFSGDWPGHLQRTLEALIGSGVTVMYFNGAEGDQSPTPRAAGAPAWEQAERYGRELAIEAWRVWGRIKPERAPVLAHHVERFPLPKRAPHPDFMKTGGKEYGLNEENIGALLEQLFPAETHSTSLRLGDWVIAGVPGEMAAGLGLQVKAAVRDKLGVKHVAIGGLAGEWVSYLLAPEAYRKGGYEASVSFYGETLGPTAVEAAVRGAAQLK
jgi:hypothetical protein